MKNVKVSVIIPVYNVESYLHECLDSIINQTMRNIEIICINDGSTDNSLNILEKYSQKDDRIVIVNQDNQGLGATRNNGFSLAKGEYIYFLDSDDFIELNLFELSYNKAISNNSDIVVFGCNRYNNDTKIYTDKIDGKQNGINMQNLPEKDVISYKDMPDIIFNSFLNCVWNKLFKRSFLNKNNILHQTLHRAEDVYFVNLSLVCAERISVVDTTLIYYRLTRKSNSFTLDLYPYDIFNALSTLKAKLIEINVYHSVKQSFAKLVILNLFYNLNAQKTYDGFKKTYEYIVKNCEKNFSLANFSDFFATQTPYLIECFKNYELISKITVDEYITLKEKHFITDEDSTIKISVIIPVYNVKKYLTDCLDSVINQTLKSIEIICINDGSTDDSIDILRKYANKDNRITILNQPNRGVSATRNKGLSIAKGKYIYFLDSDDMIVPYALEHMYEEAVVNNLDIIYCDGKPFYETSELQHKYKHYKTLYQSNFAINQVLSGAEMFAKMNTSDCYRVNSCLYLIKKDFLVNENITFSEGIIHEDNIFMFKTIFQAQRVKHIKEELFLKRIRINSILTQDSTFQHFYGYLICYMELLDFVNNTNIEIEDGVLTILNNIYSEAINCYKELDQSEKDKIVSLTKNQKYYFDTFFAYKIKFNYTDADFVDIQNKLNCNETELDKANKQVKLLENKLKLTQNANVQNQKLANQYKGQVDYYKDKYLDTKNLSNKYKGQVTYHKREKESIIKSLSYKFGRIITWLPRKIKRFLKG